MGAGRSSTVCLPYAFTSLFPPRVPADDTSVTEATVGTARAARRLIGASVVCP